MQLAVNEAFYLFIYLFICLFIYLFYISYIWSVETSKYVSFNAFDGVTNMT